MALVLASLAACGGDDLKLSFKCSDGYPNSCPAEATCPGVALDASSCGDVPGLFGHAAITVEGGLPAGCVATLPYENPSFPGDAQSCVCTTMFSDPPGTAQWSCPL